MRNARCLSTPDSKRKLAGLTRLAWLVLLLGFATPVWAQSTCAGLPGGTKNALVLAAGGAIAVGGAHPGYTMSLSGNVNGLGVGNTTGATGTAATDGFWYTTSIILRPCNYNGGATTASVSVWASSNTQFAACAATGCTGTKLGTATPGTTVATGLADGSSTTINLGLFVSNQSGAGFSTTGATSIVVSLKLLTDKGGTETITLTISFTNQNAVTLALKDTSNATISSVVFGNVNGLGAGTPTAGLTLLTPACGSPCVINPGVIYSYQYSITPTFSSFASSTTGHVQVQVTSDFTHSGTLQLMDSGAASFASFVAIGRQSQGGSTTITTTASNTVAITRYLGLEVLHTNASGPTFGTGADSATLTYTVTGQ